MTLQAAVETRPSSVDVEIRVLGRVQGVGFRPTVWRYARELGLNGDVRNDAQGVLIRVTGNASAVRKLVARLEQEPPPLARIERIEQTRVFDTMPEGFRIASTLSGETHTEITPDAAVCAECAKEVVNPFERRFRYPFANCTHCGPRFSILRDVPYDRAATAMAEFPLCVHCAAEYGEPAERRFNAEAIACHVCGPRARLIRLDGRRISFDQHSMLDDVDAVCSLLQKGEIVAFKGLGGYQLACDATNAEVVRRLRERKHRPAKPFALMARDLDVVRRHCDVSEAEARLLRSPQAPIVLLKSRGALPDVVAPGLDILGMMLPTTPMHLLALRRMDQPVVMTSGNVADEPQLIDDAQAQTRLAAIADYALVHNRRIEVRLDDSVARIMDSVPRLLRRARGYAPESITLPPGFERAPDILAFGGELKATFCLVKDGKAILSQHQGDLESEAVFDDYRRNLSLYASLYDHAPVCLAADLHPDYLSSKLARSRAVENGLPLIEMQHHHAHIAACMAENGRALDAPPVLGIALDGLGWGRDGTIWGGEFLFADYRDAKRLATFKPVAMPGGAQASREPWRNLYAHLKAEMGWAAFSMNFSELEVYDFLAAAPRATLDAMIASNINVPLASSCGRLFDAVAAALNICRARQDYEGEAAMRLEALVDEDELNADDSLAYPFPIPRLADNRLPYLEPLAMWNALLGDLILKTPGPVIAARFHKGLAKAIAAMVAKLASAEDGIHFDTVALSGGCFQNRHLFEGVVRRLKGQRFKVLTHAAVPANDGGLALGQAAIAAAQEMERVKCA